ncbi:hypothetical protein CLIB1423_02S09032 [[Candida] railenensis]|uniref:non-specific serine/threonine protein kinase n=1 Tax=[Candida] railenensis TaxID=45579 RepID=A0A9P0QLZ5_9ASCO|nr:hypothetical protein CLIB1423_02S09032 [[Candida] railenensis]
MSIGDDYEPLEVIGRGSYGIVRKVRLISDGSYHVRKEIEYNSMNAQERNQLISELRILRELNHPNIVKYYAHDHLPDKKSIHIYMEYCDGGDLASVIANFKKTKTVVPEEFVWNVLVQTLLALHRCHYGVDASKVNLFNQESNNSSTSDEPKINSDTVIIHRDIKPDNIFMLNQSETQIKLGDFGLAKMLTSKNEFAKTYVGTPYYMSPEVLMDQPYSPVCDIWSLGCVLYELCTLQPPFQAKTHLQLQTRIKIGTYKPISEQHYSVHLRTIIDDCITVDVESRPSCFELLENLPIKFLRKEMELKERQSSLNDFQRQLLVKNEELKKKESFISSLERKVFSQKDDLETEYQSMLKKFNTHKKKIEEELIDEFELRKKAMDQEAKEVRIGYQKEFKLVVEQEVQNRLNEIMDKFKLYNQQQLQNTQHQQVHQQAQSLQQQLQNQLHIQQQQLETFKRNEGPTRSISTESFKSSSSQQSSSSSSSSPIKLKGPRELERERVPLKSRNYNDADEYHYKATALPSAQVQLQPQQQQQARMPGANYRTRITDELERVNLEKRHTPEYEELYIRKNFRN